MTEKKAKEIEEICAVVRQATTPDQQERAKLLHFSERMVTDLTKRFRNTRIKVDVQIEGSIAKDTWLAGEKDIDVFLLLPKTYTREALLQVLDVVKSYIGNKWLEAYAEHPYVRAEVDGYNVDFVPCFKLEGNDKAISSVDRSPLHTSYVKNRLDQHIKNEIRLLKQFMRGIGIYGAEIRVGGFSGYLCELLILKYKSFPNTLRSASEWRRREIIDIENYYGGEASRVEQIFNSPLIVIDPVDAERNVASAITDERLGDFIRASRQFVNKPDLTYFFPDKKEPISPVSLSEQLKELGFDLIALVFHSERMAPDVLWGQLYKSKRALYTLLTKYDFKVLKATAWSDEQQLNVLLFGLESACLPEVTIHKGPPYDSKEADKFLTKYLNIESTRLGPWIEGSRWVVGITRRYIDVTSLLREKLEEGGRDIGVASKLTFPIKSTLQILVNEQIVEMYSTNKQFGSFLLGFLLGKPRWLKG